MFKNKKTVIFFTLIVVLSLVLTLGCSRNNSESQGNDQNNEPVEEPQKLTIEELYPLNVGIIGSMLALEMNLLPLNKRCFIEKIIEYSYRW